jgi:hypothetical protein
VRCARPRAFIRIVEQIFPRGGELINEFATRFDRAFTVVIGRLVQTVGDVGPALPRKASSS